METRPQQELYSRVLSDAVVDWGTMGPGEEWVNSATHEGELESVPRRSHEDDLTPMVQNGETLSDGAKSSSREDDCWTHTSVSHCDNWDMSTTWDLQLDSSDRGRLTAGFLDSEPLKEADEDLVSEVNLNNSVMTEEEREEIQQELLKLEEEIGTLKQVLASKERQHAELKQKLGISAFSEFRNNFNRGWQDMQSSTAYKKTSETLSTAGQRTSAVFNNLGSAITRKFGDMRNSSSFKSFEEKVENTVSTIKTKVGGPGPGGSFEDVLSSAANASSQDTPTNSLTNRPEGPC